MDMEVLSKTKTEEIKASSFSFPLSLAPRMMTITVQYLFCREDY